jgi:alkylation response protein AidB-like acyl-CoA dehydrogenase
MPVDAERRLRELDRAGALALPQPGAGATPARLEALWSLAEGEDLSVARLAEAHTDALAILAEAGRPSPGGMLLGVWASNRSADPLTAAPVDGGWRVRGTKAFCSGVTILDAALVTATTPDGELLLLVPLRDGGVRADTTVWHTPALAATATGNVDIDLHVPAAAAVGDPGFYVDRPGLWHGAIGVAACWAGGAAGLAATVRAGLSGDDRHALAHLGAIETALWGMRAVLADAGRAIDVDPADRRGIGFPRALMVRHLVAEHCGAILDRADRALGPGPLAFDAAYAQRAMDLRLYIQQHHYERDLETIGRAGPVRPGAADECGGGGPGTARA